MKRIATIQDISCLGKCSLTVALPLISACGVEACVVPTAVLSTHTMFKNYTFRDLTSDMPDILKHWKAENFKFDAIYTGYLGSFEQIEIVKDYFRELKSENTITVVDPVMADNGKLYPGFDKAFAEKMFSLCGVADIILPNLTEATIMLNKPYIASGYSRDYIEDILRELTLSGAKTAVITGVSFESGKIGVMGYDSVKKEFFEYYNDKVDAAYHGTGDIFSSVFVGALESGKSVLEALSVAADFTAECIRVTKSDKNAVTYGVNFELVMPKLIKLLENER